MSYIQGIYHNILTLHVTFCVLKLSMEIKLVDAQYKTFVNLWCIIIDVGVLVVFYISLNHCNYVDIRSYSYTALSVRTCTS